MPPTKKQKLEKHCEEIDIPNQLLRWKDSHSVYKVNLVGRDGEKYLCHFEGGSKK